jgi:MFS family permease
VAVVSLRRNTAYQRLWISSTLSLVGTLASFVALPLLILDSFHTPAMVGLVSFAAAVTLLLVLPWAGLVVDRVGWRAVMIGADLVRAAALALLTIAIIGDRVTLAVVLAVTVVNSALSVSALSAVGAALRASVDAAQLPAALAFNQGRTAVVGILGPVGGAALYEHSAALPFAVDVASFLLAALCVCTLRAGTTTSAGEPEPRWREVSAGWRFVRDHPFLRCMVLYIIVMDFSFNGLVLALVVISSADGNAMGAGLIMAASAAGNVLGSALALPAMRRKRPRVLVVLSVWTAAASFPIIAAHAGTPWSAVLVGFACVTAPIVAVLTNTTILKETPVHLVGRVQSIFQTMPRLVAASGPPCAGVLLTLLPARVVVLVFAVPVVALAMYITGARALRVWS